MKSIYLTFSLTILAFFLVSLETNAQQTESLEVNLSPKKRTSEYAVSPRKIAMDGFDPVSYFEERKPRKGKLGIKHTHKGITYNFMNEEHKELFIKNPDKYEPHFGGWCAYAMGKKGKKMKPNPSSFKMINGRVALFTTNNGKDLLPAWNKKEAKLLPAAQSNWNNFLK